MAAALSNTGYLALKLAIIASTGLLILQPTKMSADDTSFNVGESFNGTGFNASHVTNEPFQRYYGIKTLNLSYPAGTSDSLVIPLFESVTNQPGTTSLVADVEGFATFLDCEVVKPTRGAEFQAPWIALLEEFYTVNIETPSCNISGVMVGQGPKEVDDLTYDIEYRNLQQYQGWWGNYTCNSGVDVDNFRPGAAPIDPGLKDHRLVITTSLVKWNQTNYPRRTWLDQYTTLLCNASHEINQYRVTRSLSDELAGKPVQASRSDSGNSRNIPEISPLDIMLAVKQATKGAPLGYAGVTHQAGSQYSSNALASSKYKLPDQFFLLLQNMKGDADIDAFMDPTLLKLYATKAFTGIFTQIVHDNLLEASNRSVIGIVLYEAQRLQAEPLSFGIMLSCLIIASVITILLVQLAPRNVVPRNPQSIGASATLLAASHDFRQNLLRPGSDTSLKLEQILSQSRFQIHATKHRFQIIPTQSRKAIGTDTVDQTIDKKLQPPKRWTTMALDTWYAILAIALPVVTIIALQVVQSVSDTRDGFMDVSEDSAYKAWYIYIPALVLAGEATIYASLQFSTALLAPLLKMRYRTAPARQSLSSDLVSQTYFEALYHSVRSGYTSSAASIIAAFVGIFLTTVSSGLYHIENVPLSQPMEVILQDVFNLSTNNPALSPGDNFAGAVTGLIFEKNLSFPQWTYEDMVFPQVQLHTSNKHVPLSPQNSSVSIQLPALKPALNCSLEDSSKVVFNGIQTQYQTGAYGNGDNQYSVGFTVTPSEICPGYKNSQLYPQNLTMGVAMPFNGTEIYSGGMRDALRWSLYVNASTNQPLPNGTQCKSVAFLVMSSNSSWAKGTNFSTPATKWGSTVSWETQVLTCYQIVRQVMTNVTFLMPGFTIDTDHPPVHIGSTATYLPSSAGGVNFNFQTEQHMLFEMETNHADLPDQLHPAVYAMVHGAWGTPIKEFFGEDGGSKFYDAANIVWSGYMAQAININFRQPVDAAAGENKSLIYSGVSLQVDRGRLKQDAAVKLTLQVMLAVMLVCGIITYLTLDGKRLLLHDPCSIAGMMSLYAGSDLTGREDLIAPGSEWNTVKEDETMWQGYLFSLGWWKTADGGWRYGIDVGMAEKCGEDRESWRRRLLPTWRRHPAVYQKPQGG